MLLWITCFVRVVEMSISSVNTEFIHCHEMRIKLYVCVKVAFVCVPNSESLQDR
jgi:hypothetical protein